jgi:putative NIF3 family GTP cyclohydrolase 1 type 2
MDMTRRSLLLTGTGAAVAAAHVMARPQSNAKPAAGGLTAGAVIDRIKANVGVPWMAETVDKIIAGSPDVAVRGVATTMMATFDVVQRAAAAGKNMIITHEPTFYSHQDATDALGSDATFQAKRDFITSHDMVIFRFHDHWHRRSPDGIATGMARELGWEKFADPKSPRQFVLPGVPLSKLAKDIETALSIRTMRVVGDPALPINRVAANWGYASYTPGNQNFARPDVDAYVIGETREWELVEYVQDQIAAGRKKALIVLGHVVSEQAGMKYCAEWLKSFVTEMPIELVAAGEPFWRP